MRGRSIGRLSARTAKIDGRTALVQTRWVAAKRKLGRPTTHRGLEAKSALVRFNHAEYEVTEKAIALQTKDVIGGQSVTVAAFARHAAIGVAQRILDEAEK
jgi:hypothetical protein